MKHYQIILQINSNVFISNNVPAFDVTNVLVKLFQKQNHPQILGQLSYQKHIKQQICQSKPLKAEVTHS